MITQRLNRKQTSSARTFCSPSSPLLRAVVLSRDTSLLWAIDLYDNGPDAVKATACCPGPCHDTVMRVVSMEDDSLLNPFHAICADFPQSLCPPLSSSNPRLPPALSPLPHGSAPSPSAMPQPPSQMHTTARATAMEVPADKTTMIIVSVASTLLAIVGIGGVGLVVMIRRAKERRCGRPLTNELAVEAVATASAHAIEMTELPSSFPPAAVDADELTVL